MTDPDTGTVPEQFQDDPGIDQPDVRLTPPVLDRVTVVVVGSQSWEAGAAVEEILSNWWINHGQPPVNLVTSGCPDGAEAAARKFAAGNGWDLIQMRDEELQRLAGAIAFVFIRDQSVGASNVLVTVEQAKMWHRVFRDDTVRQVSAWADR